MALDWGTRMTSKPLTLSERVTRSNAALVARGGCRNPSGYLQPEVAEALDALVLAGYAPSRLAVIAQAVLDAKRKMDRTQKK